MPTPAKSTDQPRSATAKLDKELAASAVNKMIKGETPTSAERSALRRHEKQQEETKRWEYYSAIPQKHWREMSGRQTKILQEQADRYDIPFAGRTINLPKVVRAFHDFLAKNARKLNTDDDALMQGDSSNSPALERYREERAALARLDRLEREATLVSRDEVRQGLGRIAATLRNAGETIQRQFGNAASDVIIEALDDAENDIARWLGQRTNGTAGADGDQ
jgi:hypothetical protein